MTTARKAREKAVYSQSSPASASLPGQTAAATGRDPIGAGELQPEAAVSTPTTHAAKDVHNAAFTARRTCAAASDA